MKLCLFCKDPLEGRVDKVFCNPNCKSSHHYKLSQEKEANLYNRIDNQLKLNRRILKTFNRSGKATVRKELLLNEGFNPKYFTHYWKNSKNEVYLFCYEFGFIERKENDRIKYVLIHSQDYMK